MQLTGIERQHTVFFVEDHHMVKSEFLENNNSLLSCGEVPGIWTPDELKPLLAPLKEEWAASQGRGAVQARTPFEYFVHQVRSHMRIVLSIDANLSHFLTFCAANPALFSCCNVMWLDDWSEKSMLFVVQRQLTDVSDCKKNNLPQLLTSIHKSFVTLLQTCKAIYKVVTNVMEGIFFQVKTVLPQGKWPDELPQPQVWVESQKDWHEICAGAAERGIFTFLKEQDVFHFQGKPLLNGLFGVEKKNKSLDSCEPVLRMIINAIPANALQETIEADTRTLPYF